MWFVLTSSAGFSGSEYVHQECQQQRMAWLSLWMCNPAYGFAVVHSSNVCHTRPRIIRRTWLAVEWIGEISKAFLCVTWLGFCDGTFVSLEISSGVIFRLISSVIPRLFCQCIRQICKRKCMNQIIYLRYLWGLMTVSQVVHIVEFVHDKYTGILVEMVHTVHWRCIVWITKPYIAAVIKQSPLETSR